MSANARIINFVKIYKLYISLIYNPEIDVEPLVDEFYLHFTGSFILYIFIVLSKTRHCLSNGRIPALIV